MVTTEKTNKEIADEMNITQEQWNLRIALRHLTWQFAGIDLKEDEEGYFYLEVRKDENTI